MGEPRHPGQVSEDPVLDIDTDGNGVPDTAVACDGVDLVVLTDLDGDRFADQVLRIGSDGIVRDAGPEHPAGPGSGITDGLLGCAAAGSGS
jgi:hypothetical protein